MNLIKTHKINPVYIRPGDSMHLHYSYQEEADGPYISKHLKMDVFDEPMTIDTVHVYRTESGEFGLKAGRALIMGEDDGTYKDLPISKGYTQLIGGRKTRDEKINP
jgi:hypothetical protein